MNAKISDIVSIGCFWLCILLLSGCSDTDSEDAEASIDELSTYNEDELRSIALEVPETALGSRFSDGHALLRACTSNDPRGNGYCVGYLTSAFSTMAMSLDLCEPEEGVTEAQVRDVVLQYLNNNPAQLEWAAMELVGRALMYHEPFQECSLESFGEKSLFASFAMTGGELLELCREKDQSSTNFCLGRVAGSADQGWTYGRICEPEERVKLPKLTTLVLAYLDTRLKERHSDDATVLVAQIINQVFPPTGEEVGGPILVGKTEIVGPTRPHKQRTPCASPTELAKALL